MPPPKFTNLSVHTKEFFAIKRKFQARYGDIPMVNWIMESMNDALDRLEIIEKVFSHLKVIEIKPGKMTLVDTRQAKMADISVKDGIFTCTLDAGYCEHVAFACLHPQFRIKL